ncbi:hypothetical protein ACVB8X_28790 [Streptomyces sp. NRAIS4]
MSPAGGIGANTALRDACLLAAALEEAADGRWLIDVLADYESAMTRYGFDAVRASAANGQRMLGQDPVTDVLTALPLGKPDGRAIKSSTAVLRTPT